MIWVLRRPVRYVRWIRSTLIDLIAPMACPVCDFETRENPICPDCREQISTPALRCMRCAMPVGPFARLDQGCGVCRNRQLGFDAAITIGTYKASMRQLCLKIKHQPDAWLARWLADLLVDTRQPLLIHEMRDGIPPIIVPIPLHWKRRLRRGYNQADAIAKRMAHRLHFPISHALRRVRDTEPLAGKKRTQRLELMRNVFEVAKADKIKGRTILLVDDILTSGATCGSAARALKKAGAKRVVVVVLART